MNHKPQMREGEYFYGSKERNHKSNARPGR